MLKKKEIEQTRFPKVKKSYQKSEKKIIQNRFSWSKYAIKRENISIECMIDGENLNS